MIITRKIKQQKKYYKNNMKEKHDKKKVKCFKCGKKCHYKNECKIKYKINQLKISNREKEDLHKILERRDIDSSADEDE